MNDLDIRVAFRIDISDNQYPFLAGLDISL